MELMTSGMLADGEKLQVWLSRSLRQSRIQMSCELRHYPTTEPIRVLKPYVNP